VNAVYAEPDAPEGAWPAVDKAIHELAAWLGAAAVEYGTVDPQWVSTAAMRGG
jgi:hypothetical protein